MGVSARQDLKPINYLFPGLQVDGDKHDGQHKHNQHGGAPDFPRLPLYRELFVFKNRNQAFKHLLHDCHWHFFDKDSLSCGPIRLGH
jgi:hypothetical protein